MIMIIMIIMIMIIMIILNDNNNNNSLPSSATRCAPSPCGEDLEISVRRAPPRAAPSATSLPLPGRCAPNLILTLTKTAAWRRSGFAKR